MLQEAKEQFKENKDRGKDASFRLSYREPRTESRQLLSEAKQHFSSFDPNNYKSQARFDPSSIEKSSNYNHFKQAPLAG